MTTPITDQKPSRSPTIAVVAVHGVGEHARGASAQAIVDLLLRTEDEGSALPRYTAFDETPVRIPIKPVVVGERSRPHTPKGLRRSIFTEQSDYLRTQYLRRRGRGGYRSADLPEHQFMRAQLERYESSGQPYETVRLAGERLSSADTNAPSVPEADVHVYEMYWSDLSQLGSDGIRFFGALYQLLFHLAHLGRVAVDHARLEFRRSRLWWAFGTAHEWAVRTLTLFIPVIWLVMLATILGGIVLQIGDGAKPIVVVLTFGAALIAAALIRAYHASDAGKVRFDPIVPTLAVLATTAFAYKVLGEDPTNRVHLVHLNRALLVVWLLLAGGLLHLIFRSYQRLRPGVWIVGTTTYVSAMIAVLAVVVPAPDQATMFARTVHIFEVETAVIMVAWYALYVLGVISGALGIAVYFAAKPGTGARQRASDVAWTARTTLAVSSSMVLVVTFVMWSAVLSLTKDMLPGDAERAFVPIFRRGAKSYHAFFDQMLGVTAGPGFVVLLMIICLIVIVGLVALLPAVIKDVFPPKVGERFRMRAMRSGRTPSADPRRARQLREDAISQKLGGWVTGGLAAIGFATGVLFVATFVFMPVLNVMDYAAGHHAGSLLEDIEGWAKRVILLAGGSLTAAAVGLISFRQRLDALALGFRPAVDAALDVDNYLREHPRNNTPRARIGERHASLLRYLCNWRDGADNPYSAIVLVTHSQGTVISADLLKFIQREPDPELAPLRNGGNAEPALYLFTMGSPLRQLYAKSFPHLFGWIRGDVQDWFKPRDVHLPPRQTGASVQRAPGHPVGEPRIASDAAPNPWELGASRWVNAYRSGDYVGRSLWRVDMKNEETLYRSAPASKAGAAEVHTTIVVSEDEARARRELCIGAGAHTHYWDETAKAIAVELDLIIGEATENVRLRRAPVHAGVVSAVVAGSERGVTA